MYIGPDAMMPIASALAAVAAAVVAFWQRIRLFVSARLGTRGTPPADKPEQR